MLLHFGSQSENAAWLEEGAGFPDMPKLNSRMEKLKEHKQAKKEKDQKQQSENSSEHKESNKGEQEEKVQVPSAATADIKRKK